MSNLTIIIPAFNEADSLRILMPELLEFCVQYDFRLIIVNDGSTDDTRHVLEQYLNSPCFSMATHKVNRGYGGAVKSGISRTDTKYFITIDADGQHDLNDVVALHKAIIENDADMIIGNRNAHPEASIYRGIGKTLIRWFAKFLLPIDINDLNSGIRICNTELARRYSKLCPDHFAFSDIITMVFISQRRLVLEQPVSLNPRTAGKSTISTLTAVETVREILNIVILFNPMRVFFPIATISIAASLLWGVPIIMAGRGVSVAALLGFTTGLVYGDEPDIKTHLNQLFLRVTHLCQV